MQQHRTSTSSHSTWPPFDGSLNLRQLCHGIWTCHNSFCFVKRIRYQQQQKGNGGNHAPSTGGKRFARYSIGNRLVAKRQTRDLSLSLSHTHSLSLSFIGARAHKIPRRDIGRTHDGVLPYSWQCSSVLVTVFGWESPSLRNANTLSLSLGLVPSTSLDGISAELMTVTVLVTVFDWESPSCETPSRALSFVNTWWWPQHPSTGDRPWMSLDGRSSMFSRSSIGKCLNNAPLNVLSPRHFSAESRQYSQYSCGLRLCT